MKKRYLGMAMGMAMAAISSTASATDVMEVEVNHPITAAQYMVMPADPLTISAQLGDGYYADLDYYTFNGQAGDVVTIDIDGAYQAPYYLDTIVAVFGQAPSYTILRMDDDAWPLDPGSVHPYDSRIDNFVLPYTGQYVVGVSNFPRFFMNGGNVRNNYWPRTGSYQLVISGVTPAVQQISIEIKPGNDEIAPVNPKSRGKVPVALLSGPDFDPADVAVDTLTFGSSGDEESLFKCHKDGEDLNLDGIADMVCQFDNQTANFKAWDAEGILRGETSSGQAIEGRGYLKVVPEKAPQE